MHRSSPEDKTKRHRDEINFGKLTADLFDAAAEREALRTVRHHDAFTLWIISAPQYLNLSSVLLPEITICVLNLIHRIATPLVMWVVGIF